MERRREPINFTEARVRDLPAEAERYEVRDLGCTGLVLRVFPSGVKTFTVIYRARGGAVERVKVGRWPGVTVIEARKAAKPLTGRAALGHNPAEERRGLRAESTLAELWTRYLEHAKRTKRSWKTDELRWNKHLAVLGKRRLSEVTQRRIQQRLDDVTTQAGPVAANRVRALLGSMFSYARKRLELSMPNPVRETEKHSERDRARTRYLHPDELRRFIRTVEADHDRTTREWILFTLYTGQRRGTVSRARWGDLNLEDAVWSIPAEAMKAKRPLTVPLPRPVVDLLRRRADEVGTRGVYVFPSPRPEGFMAPPQKGFERVVKAAGLVDVTPHTLRRTYATWAGGTVPAFVLAALLGHTAPRGLEVTASYAMTPVEMLRPWAEKTVDSMRAVAEAEEGKVLHFPGTAEVKQ